MEIIFQVNVRVSLTILMLKHIYINFSCLSYVKINRPKGGVLC